MVLVFAHFVVQYHARSTAGSTYRKLTIEAHFSVQLALDDTSQLLA